MVASSSDWVGHSNPTGWGFPPEYINIGAHGLVGHCWKALTITTTYDAPQTVTGIQSDANKPFSIEHSSDGETWVLVGSDFNGSLQEIALEPFTCTMTRMTWTDTSGTNGFHAQFVGRASTSGGEEGGEEGGEAGGESNGGEQDHASGSDDSGGGGEPDDASGCEIGGECSEIGGETDNDGACDEPSSACVDVLFADATEQLHDEVEACRHSAEEAMSDAVSEALNEHDDDDLDERLAQGLAAFDAEYEAQVSALQASLSASHTEHVKRIAEAREAHAKSREEKMQKAMDTMRAKIDAVRARVEDGFLE